MSLLVESEPSWLLAVESDWRERLMTVDLSSSSNESARVSNRDCSKTLRLGIEGLELRTFLLRLMKVLDFVLGMPSTTLRMRL